MAHRFYASFSPSTVQFPRDKSLLIPIIYEDFDDTLGAAKNADARGLCVHGIETSDGVILKPAAIRPLIRKLGGQLTGRPRVS